MKTMLSHKIAFAVLLSSSAFLASPSVQAAPADFPVTNGLSLFLDAESIETDGPHVTRMIDLSGRGNDALENVLPGPRKPVVVPAATPAGLDAIRFDGLGGYLEVPSNYPLLDGRARTTLVVFRPHVLGVGRLVNSAFSSLNPDDPEATPRYSVHSMFANSGGVLRIQNRTATGGSIAVSTEGGAIAQDHFYVGASVWLDDGLSVVSVRDESNQRFVSQTEGADATPSGHIWTRIGANAGTTNPDPIDFFDGDIAAVLIYDRALSPIELEGMEEYLRKLYLTGELSPAAIAQPAVVDGLVVHLDASNAQTTGTTVDAVLDISGYNNHATGLVIGEAPPRSAPLVSSGATPSGRDAILFDGENHYLEVAGNPSDFDGDGKTTLVVFRAHEFGSGRLINSAYASLNPGDPEPSPHYSVHSLFPRSGGDVRIQNRNLTGGSVSLSTDSGVVDSEGFFIGGNILIPGGQHVALARNANGERFVTTDDGATAIPTGHLWTWLGANSSPSAESPRDFFNGKIAAVVVFNRAIDPDELIQVEEYLQERYLQAPEGQSYQAWIDGFDLPVDQRGLEDNPSGDGISNLMKYALGLDPTEASRDQLPAAHLEAIGSDRHLEITVHKNPLATNVSYVAEVSSDLVAWHSDSEHVEIVVDDAAMLRARDRQPLGDQQKRFLRVNVILLEN